MPHKYSILLLIKNFDTTFCGSFCNFYALFFAPICLSAFASPVFQCHYFSFSPSISLCASCSHSGNPSLPASAAPSSHTLRGRTNHFPGRRRRLKSGPWLFWPRRQQIAMSNLMHVNSQEEWRITAGTQWEGKRGEIPSVHVTADFTVALSRLPPKDQEGAPGGTVTEQGTCALHTHASWSHWRALAEPTRAYPSIHRNTFRS